MDPVAAADPTEALRARTEAAEHANCFACSDKGLGLDFTCHEDGTVGATWMPYPCFQSYPGVLHGGIAATLLDCAMVHALFARGIAAVTGEIRVRFHESIDIVNPVQVTAHVSQAHGPLWILEATIVQEGRRKASGSAKFIRRPDAGDSV